MAYKRKRKQKHLYRHGAKAGELRSFESRYGKRKGKRVYGAVLGKVRRERMQKHKRSHLW